MEKLTAIEIKEYIHNDCERIVEMKRKYFVPPTENPEAAMHKIQVGNILDNAYNQLREISYGIY